MKMPAAGEVFEAKYRVDEVIGEGSFGLVLKATALATGRAVAIKVLKADGPGYETSREKRFLREMRAIAQLQCPYTLTLFDFGRTDAGLLYMVLEYVDGEDLLELLIHRGTLDEADAKRVLYQVLQSLSEAHSAGILHRDIKPGNIRITRDADRRMNVKVLDFGLAKSLEPGEARLTSTGNVIGTPRYMAPEQLLGAELTPACDIFSLGVVAIEMLEGRQRTVGGGPLRQLSLSDDAEVSGPLKAVVNRMVDGDPDRRWQSAPDVLLALREAGRGALPAREDDTTVKKQLEPEPGRSPIRNPDAPDGRPRWPWFAGALLLFLLPTFVFMLTRPDEPVGMSRTARTLPALVTPVDPVVTPIVDAGAPLTCGMPQEPGLIWLWRGSEISWAVHVPAGYDQRTELPVVLFLPDEVSAHTGRFETTGLADMADKESFVAIIPIFSAEHVATWRKAYHRFIRSMLDELASHVCVDVGRVYAFGDLEGAHRIPRLACMPWITAVSSHDLRPRPRSECERRRPYLHSIATDSLVIPMEGGLSCVRLGVVAPSHNEVLENWRKHHHCSNNRTEVFTHADGTCWSFADCEEPLTLCESKGGYGWHQVNGSLARQLCPKEPRTSHFPELEVAWEFFQRFENRAPSCSKAVEIAGRRHEVREGKREGLLVVPRGYDGQHSLAIVVAFHGRDQTPAQLLDDTELEALAEKHGVALLVPNDDALEPWFDPESSDGVRELVDRASELICIDHDRVWMWGNGAGEHAVAELGCGRWVAAIAHPNPACDVPSIALDGPESLPEVFEFFQAHER